MRPFPVILPLIALVSWAAVLAYFSLAPAVAAPAGLKIWDKFSHFSAYAVLGVLMILALANRFTLSWHRLLVAWLLCVSYGLLLECLQWTMAIGRHFEPGDLLANGLGALLGCVIFCRNVRR